MSFALPRSAPTLSRFNSLLRCSFSVGRTSRYLTTPHSEAHINHLINRTMSTESPTKKPLTKRAVVTSFIFKFPDGDGRQGRPQVALFRRSDKVSTYR